ncbi:helix-turn-helix domain-containing protein [Paraburkholderia sp. 5N]|uniref:Helix-turn-helix domain-containing protein n=2 Tax=Paraburkholderia elongata TaxID=2675747 RepID=A0A972SNS7_9BURK|nr:helix-turn-helix domain-containing protein [Paraburkholderia elongata]
MPRVSIAEQGRVRDMGLGSASSLPYIRFRDFLSTYKLARRDVKLQSESNIGQADTEGALSASRAPAVARAAAVLRLLAGERSGLGVNEIARRVDLVPSTCLHVLRALVDEGFVSFDPVDKTYRTGIGLMTLVRAAMGAREYPKLVQPVLDELSSQHQVTAIAIELDTRDRMVVVALSRSNHMVSLHVNIGSRFPAYISATGRCVAAARNLPRDELKRQFSALRWEKPPRFEDWCTEVERTKLEGVAVDLGNYMRGVIVAATLLPKGADRATRGIAVVGFEHHMTPKSLRQLENDLREAAGTVGAQLA